MKHLLGAQALHKTVVRRRCTPTTPGMKVSSTTASAMATERFICRMAQSTNVNGATMNDMVPGESTGLMVPFSAVITYVDCGMAMA
mmetsp:Transcript_20795/g.48627  ORF Transcript_20795/g.48627 Transcript_20795/m.48627 type:complete len:86 (-) Transcript_20795:564-821(-)